MKSIVLSLILICSGSAFAGTINHLDRISVGEFDEVMANSPLYKHLASLKGKEKTDALLALEVLKVELLYKINESNKRIEKIHPKLI